MQCNVCEFRCDVNKYSMGRCGNYIYTGSTIIQHPGIGYLGAYSIPIESVPLFNYYPSGKFLQVFSTGCNFQCPGCSTRILASSKPLNKLSLSPSKVVEKALQQECLGIVSTLNDPVANYYLFRDLAVKAKKKNLLTGCSTNCYFTNDVINELGQFVDFMKVGIKGYSDRSYMTCGAPSSAPVFRNISQLFNMEIHIEASVTYFKGNEKEVMQVAEAISNISPAIPLHVMRFIPFGYAPIKLEPSVGEAEKLCMTLRKYADHVYLLNSPGTKLLNTYCPKCGTLQIERDFCEPMGSRIIEPWMSSTCNCGNDIQIKDRVITKSFRGEDFIDGYRISHIFRLVHAVLTCLGIQNDKLIDLWGDNKLIDVWNGISNSQDLIKIYNMVRQPYSYLEFIKFIAEKANVQKKGDELVSFINKRLKIVQNLVVENIYHKVYYCMGSPLFALSAGRMENNLVTFSGGVSINKQLHNQGKTGVNVSPDFINKQNPGIIFISGLLSCPLNEFYSLCRKNGIYADALKHQQVYEVPPAWDFGSPRWILGLLYIADKLHPGRLGIDIFNEADKFYLQFYGMRFKEARPNRSYHRPSSGVCPRHTIKETIAKKSSF